MILYLLHYVILVIESHVFLQYLMSSFRSRPSRSGHRSRAGSEREPTEPTYETTKLVDHRASYNPNFAKTIELTDI